MSSRITPVNGLLLTCLLSACSAASTQPQINFIGIGTGTLATDVNQIQFSQTFKPTDQELIAVVSFAEVSEGTRVQATWFSPDERQIPLGRTEIITQSGARIARFSFGSKDLWKAAPYQLRIDAMSGEGKTMKTASGSLSFFIGMKDRDIQTYLARYTAWLQAEQNRNAIIDQKEKVKQALTDTAQALLGTEAAAIVLQADLTGRGQTEYLIVGKKSTDMPPGGETPGTLYAGSIGQFAILNGSGQLLFIAGEKKGGKRIIRNATDTLFDQLPKTGDLQLAVLPSKTLSITWTNAKKEACSMEISANTDHQLTGKEPLCRKN